MGGAPGAANKYTAYLKKNRILILTFAPPPPKNPTEVPVLHILKFQFSKYIPVSVTSTSVIRRELASTRVSL